MAASAGLAIAGVAQAQSKAAAEEATDSPLKLGGYVRTWASFNLNDSPETGQNDRYNLSMLRASALVDASWKLGSSEWKAIGRVDREMKTSYIERLESLTHSRTPGGPGGQDVMDQYNRGELREFYVDLHPTDSVQLRLGKQQIVWGESDFFHAMDMVHGVDLRWRSFLEGENEELRKPLILANMIVQVPKVDGSFQLYVRPGWDRDKDIGNSYDLYGGRWDLRTFKAADFLSPSATLSYDYHNPEGDVRDTTWGTRWKGILGGVNYSLAYLTTFNPDPIVNSSFAPFGATPTAPFGNWIYPKIHVIGATANAYAAAIDSVLSAEVAYTRDAPYNVGLMAPGSTGILGAPPFGTENTIAGFGGVIRKKTLTTMLRADKNLDLKSLLGTDRDSFSSVQIFDKWILGYNPADEIVDIVGYNAAKPRHSTIVTGILVTNYANDTINPSLAIGFDVRNGGGFAIPGVDFVLGDKWRLKAEGDFFFAKDKRQASPTSLTGLSENQAHLFGALVGNDQLMFRLTRMF
jgi:hypothetical protein